MADDGKFTVRFNKAEEDLMEAFYRLLAQERERTRDKDFPEQALAKQLIRRGLAADTEHGHAAAIAEDELIVIRAQVAEISQGIRKLEAGIGDIRSDLASTVLVLLEHAGKLSAAKARRWVEQEFQIESDALHQTHQN